MPYSPKRKRTSRVNQIPSRTRRTKVEEWDGDSDNGDDDRREEPEDFENMVRRLMNQEEHAKWLNSKTNLVYEAIQNKSKELVKIGVFAIDEVTSTSRKVCGQETDYEKFYEDHQLTKRRQDDGYRQLHACFTSILEDLGRTRAYEVNAKSELVKNNPLHCQEIIRNFSKSMRSKFEEARKKEKENADAEALIGMVKKILYY